MSAPSFARGRPWGWYLAAATLASTGLFVLLPADGVGSIALHLAVNASVIAALAWGIRRYRPDPRAPWLVLLAAYALLLAANAARYGAGTPGPLATDPIPSGLYLIAYLGMAIGLVLLVRARGAVRDPRSLADATIVVIGASVLWFEFAVGPVLDRPETTASERFTMITYPVPDLVFLILLLWLVFSKGPRGAALLLLLGGIAAQAMADALLGISDLGLMSTGGTESPLWLLSFALVGAAVLHPSMPLIGAKSDQPSWMPAGRRVYLLAAVSVIVPLTFLRHAILMDSAGGYVLALALMALVLLVYARLRGLLVDVDTYARTQVQLAAAEARFRRLVELVPAVIYVDSTDEAATSRYVSPRYEELTGYPPEEAAAQTWLWSDHIHPADREWVMAAAREANERDEPSSLEYRIRARDGTELWVRDEATVTERDAEGRARSWQGVLIDVTEAHRAGAEIQRLNAELEQRVAERTAELATANTRLREASASLNDILAATPVILFRGRGFDFVPEYVSPSVERVLGFTPQEVLATPAFWVERLRPDDRERLVAVVRNAMEQGVPDFAFEHVMITRDGRERWMSTVVHLEVRPDGVLQTIGTSFDMTERRTAEDELRRAKEEAERASRAKSEFLSVMSHELRTPLTAVLGFAQLLELSDLSLDERADVAEILRAGRALVALIDSVLEMARVDAGLLTLSIEPVNVEAVIREAVDLIRPMAVGRNIQLVSPADAERPPWMLADRERIKQVILNLLTNAVTYNRDGGSVAVAYDVAADDRLRFSVSDTGPGIPTERQATLFTILDRRIGSDRRAPGLGIGLALSARLIEAMGGSISVESEVGAGSTFSIELPLATGPLVGSRERSEAGERIPATATVLYVEDHLVNLRLVERIIDERPGTRVLAAMQGSLCLELARYHHPDLVLLDLHLPDIPGEEVLRLLRDDPATHDISVIVLNTARDSGTGRRLLDLGAEAYLARPIDIAAFLAAVDRVLVGRVDRD